MRIMSPFMYCMSFSKVSAFGKRKNYVSEETGVYSNFSEENEENGIFCTGLYHSLLKSCGLF